VPRPAWYISRSPSEYQLGCERSSSPAVTWTSPPPPAPIVQTSIEPPRRQRSKAMRSPSGENAGRLLRPVPAISGAGPPRGRAVSGSMSRAHRLLVVDMVA